MSCCADQTGAMAPKSDGASGGATKCTTESLVPGVSPEKQQVEGAQKTGVGAKNSGCNCKCGPNCSCNPCTCK